MIDYQKLKLFVMDVDGVLTDGTLYFGAKGEALKGFHVLDGMGISLAKKAGLIPAIITGRMSEIVAARARELGIADVYQGRADKRQALEELFSHYNVTAEETAYMGDDLNDLSLLRQVALPIAPANAVPEVKAAAHVVTDKSGGSGAVREALEYILKKQGHWDSLIAQYGADPDFGRQ